MDRRYLETIHRFELQSLKYINSSRFRVELRHAIDHIRNYIEVYNPDFIIITGRKPDVIKLILEFLGIPVRFKILEWDSKINNIIYKDDQILEQDRNLQLDEILATKYPQLQKDSKILLLDDFSDTGHKAKSYKNRLQNLGFENVKFATISEEEDSFSTTNGYVDTAGSNDSKFYNAIRILSLFIAQSESLSDTQEFYKSHAPTYKTKFKEVLESFGAKPAGNLFLKWKERLWPTV